MKKAGIEIAVGTFILIGILGMTYISVNLGQVNFFEQNNYTLTATFTSATGLKPNTNVEIAGVKIGTVKNIELEDYQAKVTLAINSDVEIQDDAIASIRTKGILGENFVEILPGGSDIVLAPNETIFDTEPSFDLLSVVKNLMVGDE